MFILIALCHFSNDFSTELNCVTTYTPTEDCAATLREWKEEYKHTEQFVKVALCTKKIDHKKILPAKQSTNKWKSPI